MVSESASQVASTGKDGGCEARPPRLPAGRPRRGSGTPATGTGIAPGLRAVESGAEPLVRIVTQSPGVSLAPTSKCALN